jgi:hypothetical protein
MMKFRFEIMLAAAARAVIRLTEMQRFDLEAE